MSYYVFDPQNSYLEYLQAKKFIIETTRKPKIRLELSPKALEILADEKSLELHKIEVENEREDLKPGFLSLVYTPEESGDAYPEMLATFHWGLAYWIVKMGHMNERLSLLIQNTDSPEQTLAFNHFEKSREAFSRKDYHVAISEIKMAIYGDQTSAGFRSEWRFYYLEGVIHLGFYGCDTDIIDLKKAEEAFIHSALFARSEFPSNSSIAYMAASWAAYCQGRLSEARGYTEKAIDCYKNQPEAYFLMAKYYIAERKLAESFKFLSEAVNMNTFYALKAAGDGDFQAHEAELEEWLDKIKHEKFDKFRNSIYQDMEIMQKQNVPADQKEVIDSFAEEKSLLHLTKAEQEWNEFKVRPIFSSKEIEKLQVDHEAIVKVMEPYREKVVLKQGTWFRKEESKIVTKNKVVQRRKKSRYEITLFRDAFMFFTGKVLVDFDMILVDGGKFQMGDTTGVGRIDEKPIHDVELDSFLICKYQVTQKLWNLVMDYNPSNFHGYNLPVEHVSWYDCIEFCNNLSRLAGFEPCYTIKKAEPDPDNVNKTDNQKWTVICNWDATGYRLLTESEWEFAAKGGNNNNFYRFSGSENENMVAWFKDNSGFKTQNVGEKRPNELGIYDMSGNVWEWCWDWYDSYQEGDFINPRGPEGGSYRVLRGGSWADSINYQRSAGRGKENPTGRYTSIGMRIARTYIKK